MRESSDPRTRLRAAGLRPKKSFGQNFLVASQVATAMAEICVRDDEMGRARVVEIGAGTGVLTRGLADRAAWVVAIERDRDLIPILDAELSGSNVRVLEADAAAVDFAALLGPADASSARVLCGNLPYAITGPILRRAIQTAESLERVVFMVQEEVALRLTASPGTANWGALSVFAQAAFASKRVLRVASGAFYPAPEVTSAVVEMTPCRPPRAQETVAFRAVVRAAFQGRRKTLRNAWRPLVADVAMLEVVAKRSSVDLDARGETLEVDAFRRVAMEIQPALVSQLTHEQGRERRVSGSRRRAERGPTAPRRDRET